MSVGMCFGASGFLCVYQMGVCHFLVTKVPSFVQSLHTIQGVSGGALTAAALVGCPDKIYTELFQYAIQGQTLASLEQLLPSNIHEIASENGLEVLCAGNTDGKNERLFRFSQWESRDDFFMTLRASTLVNGSIQYRGDNIYDAGILESMPETNCDISVLVSPFAGPRATICPPDEPSKWTKSLNGQTVYINWDNYRRGTQAMQWPGEDKLKVAFFDGYDDCQEWVMKSEASQLLVTLGISTKQISSK